MKKNLCLLLIFFTFISVAPSFAKKEIVSNTYDRLVGSRLVGHEYFDEYNQPAYPTKEMIEEAQQQKEEIVEKENGNTGLTGYRVNEYETQYRQILGSDIRTELVGTSWGYPVAEQQVEEIEEVQNDENIEENFEEEQIAEENMEEEPVFHREAADYYIRDTKKSPAEERRSGGEIPEIFK